MNTTTTVSNPETGEPITHINIMRVFTYDVETIIQQFYEDNRMSLGDELVIEYDDIIDYVLEMAIDDFHEHRHNKKSLVVTDQNGSEL